MAQGKRNRNEVIYVRTTPEEKKAIRKKAKEANIKDLSAFIRRTALNGYVINVDLKEFREYAAQIAAVGNNINQIAKRINSEYEVYKTDIDAVVDEMEAIKRTVQECMDLFMGGN